MIVGIHQPHYLPWLRYIDKIARSDVFVLLDDAAYTKNGWQNRNKIKCAQGWMYLTVPVLDAFRKSIFEVRVNNQERWRGKHSTALRVNYARAPFFRRYGGYFEELYGRPWETLCDVSVHVLELVRSLLKIDTRIVRSSTLNVPGQATERLVRICKALGATTYLTGDYAAGNHLDVHAFQEQGIEVRMQDWRCVEYRQQHMQSGFIPDLSIVDLLFNEGERTLPLLAGCRSSGGIAANISPAGRLQPVAARSVQERTS